MTETATPDVVDSQGMNYLVSLPRRIVTVYVPIAAFLIVLLFPFYWMVITTLKPDQELLSRDGNPFWVRNPTLAHIKKLLFDTDMRFMQGIYVGQDGAVHRGTFGFV